MRRQILALFLVLSAAGCGGPSGAPNSPGDAGVVMRAYPRFDDADPHPWEGRVPATYPVHGIDVSRWQGDIDWPAARAGGVSFVFIKATEGVEEIDPKFEAHWRGATAAGIPAAAYHYFYFCAPAEDQARWFLANLPRGSALPQVLDMEWNHRSPTCRIRPDGATVRAEAKRFLDIVEARTGRRPILYTTVDFWEDTGIGRLPGTQFWLRSVAAHPNDRFSGANWIFWQYTGTGHVPGVPGRVDINVFHGSQAVWEAWLR